MKAGGAPPCQRAFSSLGCPEASLDEVLALAVRSGIDAVELRALGGSLDLPAYLAARAGTPSALAAALRKSPVRIVAFATSLRILDGTTADREKFLEFLPWAEALGVRRLRVFDGGKTADAAELAHAAETARWWRQLRAERGWQADIAVETHDTLITTAAIRRFLAAAPGTRILWDTHHTWKKGGEDPLATWRAIGRHVDHLHVKDSVSRPSAKHPFTYVLPGTGEFPLAGLLRELQGVRPPELKSAADFNSGGLTPLILCLEWEKLWHPYLPPLGEALRVAADKKWW